MLRHLIHVALVLIVALGIAGCGIKGPLVPAPKPEAATPSDREAPAPRKP